MSRKEQLANEIISKHSVLRTSLRLAETIHAALVQQVDQAFTRASTQIENDYRKIDQSIETERMKSYQAAASLINNALQNTDLHSASWSDGAWSTHILPTTPPASLLRLGTVCHGFTPLPDFPALLPLVGHRHVLISAEAGQSHIGAGILESLAWRIAALSAPGSYRFVLLDPLDRGATLASILKLPESIRGPKIWCDDGDIEQALRRLLGDIEDVTQRRLLDSYQNIEAYNQANPDLAVPYRFLIITGFPQGFTSKASELLASIARTGPRTGCYLLCGVLRGAKPPHDFDFAAFMKMSTYISVKGRTRLEWTDRDFGRFPVQPDGPPPSQLVESLAKAIQPLAVAASTTIVQVRQFVAPEADWWKSSSKDGVEVPVGIGESGEIASITFGPGRSYHILLGGLTRYGKTNFLHVLVLMLCTAYSPDEIELYLVDFKEGVEFKNYEKYPIPHVRAVVMEAEREFGLSVLQRLLEEMNRRSQVFKMAGVPNFEEYRSHTKQKMPRILLIVDEFVVLFQEDDRLADRAHEALAALVMRGGGFGIHVLLSAQRPVSKYRSMSDITSQMGLRIAFKCLQTDSTLILGEGNEKAARLTERGEAYFTSDPGSIAAATWTRIALLESSQRPGYLQRLQQFTRSRQYPELPCVVFSKDAPAVWATNKAVDQRLSVSQLVNEQSPTCWLGQPLQIADDIRVELQARQGANLMVVGSNEDLALPLLLMSALGLSLTISPDALRFVWIGSDNPQQTSNQALDVFQKGIPHSFDVCFRQEAVHALDQLVATMDERLKDPSVSSGQRVCLVLAGAHRWQELRSAKSYEPSEAGQKLVRLLQQGADAGIHVLLWCDHLSTFSNSMGTGPIHNTLTQFHHRVALQMDANESVTFLNGPFASTLGKDRAYYRYEQWPAGQMDKFKPYALPEPQALVSIVDRVSLGWGIGASNAA